jgi:hypothetical protein
MAAKDNAGKSTVVSARRKTTAQPKQKVTKSSKRTMTPMELKTVTESGVTKATDLLFGCRHLGVKQMFCMLVTWHKKLLEEGEFISGKKCSESTCKILPAEAILATEQEKSKMDGSVLYYCDEGCKAVHSDDPTVLRNLKCEFLEAKTAFYKHWFRAVKMH